MLLEKCDQKLGELELNYIFCYDSLSIKKQISEADLLIDQLLTMYRENLEHIRVTEEAIPVICFFNTFMIRLNAFVQEEIIDRDWLVKLTKKFIYNGTNEYETKLGLILSENYLENEELEKVIRCFCRQEQYVFYMTNAIKKMKKNNSFLLELAKESEGIIKVFAITNIENINSDINIYMIEEGYKDKKYQQLLVDYVCSNIDIARYLNTSHNKNKLDIIAYLICSYLKNHDFTKTDIKNELINTFLPLALSEGLGIKCLYLLVLITKGVEEDYDIDRNKEFAKEIRYQLSDKKWKKVFQKELENLEMDSEDLIALAEFYDYKLSFYDLYPYLLRDKCDFDVYFYFMKYGTEQDNLKLLKFFTEGFDMERLTGNIKDIDKSRLSGEYIDDLLFAVVIKACRELSPQGKTLAMLGILGNINDVRKESIIILKKYKDMLSVKEIDILKRAYSIEPNTELKKGISELIEEEMQIEKKFENVDMLKIQPHVKDIYIYSANVTGLQNKQCKGVEKEFLKNSICYLALGNDNNEINRGIKVIGADGYVIGNLPEKDNPIAVNLLKAGKYLYCRIKEFDLNKSYANIKVYLSYKDMLDQIDDIVSMLAIKNQDEFIC